MSATTSRQQPTAVRSAHSLVSSRGRRTSPDSDRARCGSWTLWLLLGALVAIPACEGPFGDAGEGWENVSPDKRGDGELETRYGRRAQRLRVDQLRRTIPRLFGVKWTDRNGKDMFKKLARTLGEPDYVELMRQNREPSPLFSKFIDDMAGQVCKKAVAADAKRSKAGERVLMRHADVDDNLRFLRLKLHAIYVPDGSRAGITGLRKLYDKALARTKSKLKAWETICVAMLTAPEFLAY